MVLAFGFKGPPIAVSTTLSAFCAVSLVLERLGMLRLLHTRQVFVSRKLANTVLHWVVLRNENTKALIHYWSFRTLKEANRKKMELEEAVGPGEVTIETLVPPDIPK